VNQHTVVREQIHSPQTPAGPRVQSISTFSSAGEASGEYQNELSRFLIRRQDSSFLPRSSLRALSGRIAHHPLRLPCSLLSRPLRPACRGGRDRGRGASAIEARPDISTGYGRALTYGIDQGADAATSVSARRIRTATIGRWARNWQRSDPKRRRRRRPRMSSRAMADWIEGTGRRQ
jgi:hypothetical protein